MTDSQNRSNELKKHLILIALITWLGFGARVINLGGDSLWFDEILTFDRAHQDIGTILAAKVVSQPPGYRVLEHYAVEVWGDSEYALRLPSALAGTLAIPLLYLLCRLIASRRVGVLASMLLAVSPFYLRYSQEARGFSIQTALALASSVCLLLALRQNRRRGWISFGIVTALNIYNLLGAFLVLSGQLVFVGLWLCAERLSGRRTWRQLFDVIRGLVLAGLIAGILCLPYLQAALRGVSYNIGSRANDAQWTGSGTPIIAWVQAAYLAFAYFKPNAAAILALLSLIGLISANRRRQTFQVLWLVCGIVLPIVLVKFVGISRAPFARYILFILPIYLLAASMGINALIDLIAGRSVGGIYLKTRSVLAVITIGVFILSLPAIIDEYAHVEEDLKSIVNYLKAHAQNGDIFVPLTLDLSDGFNQSVPGLSHYLPQAFPDYFLLSGEHLTDATVNDLKGVASSSGHVWFVVLNRVRPVRVDDSNIEVIPFKASTYLVHSVVTNRPPIEQMINIYQEIIPQALSPAPQCYLWLDLATLYLQVNRYDDAYQATLGFRTPCPQGVGMQQVIYHQLLDHYQSVRRADRVKDLALKLLQLYPRDQAALQAVSVFDLRAMFISGSPSMTAASSPARPIQIQRLTMPQSGDGGDAIVMQTPARLSYRLNLPHEPIEFRSRIALAPESWDWGGDGSVFQMQVQDQTGSTKTIYQQYVSNEDSDRDWHDVTLPLEQYAGQTITLTLITDPGPNGDTTGDWAGWDSPRIVYTAP